ncbi:MAG: radical SAM protein, partial [Sphingomonadales bacterium]
ERWRFISETLARAPTRFKFVPMIGSLGCPYSCSFCIDSTTPYQPLGFEQIGEDLKFLQKMMPRPMVGWYDPNFGVKFDAYLSVIEEAAPNGAVPFIAESSLSLLSEKNVKRLGKAGCVATLPGIESWYGMGNKSGTGRLQAADKVRQVSDHVNMILRHIPYIQTNFVLGLDDDMGAEPFELTKMFIDLTPGAFPAYSLLSAFGEAAPLNLELQRDGRVLGFPFFFLDNNKAMNVRPKNYEWPEFYDQLISLMKHSFSLKAVARRFRATDRPLAKVMNVMRAASSEGFFRLQYHKKLRRLMDTDPALRSYLEQETEVIPDFYVKKIMDSLGAFAPFLPDGAIEHDQNAYLKKTERIAKEQVAAE